MWIDYLDVFQQMYHLHLSEWKKSEKKPLFLTFDPDLPHVFLKKSVLYNVFTFSE